MEVQDHRIIRKVKGWILERGFAMEFLKKYYPNDARIVDLGCGPGHWLLHLYENGFTNISGVDIENYIVFPEKKKMNVFEKADLNCDKLPYEDYSVDIIISTQVFEH